MIRLYTLIERMNPRGIEVRPIRGEYESDIFDAMVRKHYLKGANKNINIKFGIFSGGKMIGIAAYGPPTYNLISKQLNLSSDEVSELRRFYTEQSHIYNLESQALTMANEELRDVKPNIKVIVTYADPQQGHLGILYQATNAKYLGKGKGLGGKHKYIYILGNPSEKKRTEKRIGLAGQDYPKKELQEFQVEGFDLDEFLDLRSFAAKVRYANDKLRRIASGSARVIYEIDEYTVLKLAKNAKGIAQNEVEAGIGTDKYFENILAKVLETDERDRWVVMERAKKITKSRFKNLIDGIDIDNFHNYIRKKTEHDIHYMFTVDDDMEERLNENEFAQDIIELILNYDLHPGDFSRPSSFGEIEGRLVITDYGLNQQVFKQYYDWNIRAGNAW